ncbi:SDR family oxidoreductase [Ornithinimicrobium sp. F0845]|uniref:SDR family NAD(P)-dependent oxidoreductase n=1 Tax=Ornithinimicrobium sp. F0845 TaxID=2926412 RepID=UPI001FF3CC9C|nr:SDR family oxidoreductase [Ornithinimicrobium sp. F0845]MCK0111654.1 SDR family oxidoreductase [Ornithinimicrobium sp. F0845]
MIVVTGGATGLGREVAQKFIRHGAHVVITGRRREPLLRTADEIGAQAVPCDNASAEDLAGLTDACADGVEVLVNNAGGNAAPPVANGDLTATAEAWQANFTANVLTDVLTTTALEPLLVDDGRVINVGSIAADSGSGSYGPAKAAVQSWTVDLARRLGPRRVTVNSITPGYISETEFFGDGPSEAKYASLLAATMTKRVGVPSDIAELVFFLASDAAGHVTGQTLHVNGGAQTTR